MLDGASDYRPGCSTYPAISRRRRKWIRLAKVAAPWAAMHTSHMRDEAAHVIDGVKETIRIGEEGGLPTEITHHKIIGGATGASARKHCD